MRFMVPLSDDIKTELWKLSQLEQRDMRDQAAVLIAEALKARRQQPKINFSILVDDNSQEIRIKPEVCYA